MYNKLFGQATYKWQSSTWRLCGLKFSLALVGRRTITTKQAEIVTKSDYFFLLLLFVFNHHFSAYTLYERNITMVFFSSLTVYCVLALLQHLYRLVRKLQKHIKIKIVWDDFSSQTILKYQQAIMSTSWF
jgi:hypothetical protein